MARRNRIGKAAAWRFRTTRERDLVDDEQFVASSGHQPGLEPLGRTEHEHGGIGVAFTKCVGDGEQGIHMAGGATAGEEVRGSPGDPTPLRLRGFSTTGIVRAKASSTPARDQHGEQCRASLRHERERDSITGNTPMTTPMLSTA